MPSNALVRAIAHHPGVRAAFLTVELLDGLTTLRIEVHRITGIATFRIEIGRIGSTARVRIGRRIAELSRIRTRVAATIRIRDGATTDTEARYGATEPLIAALGRDVAGVTAFVRLTADDGAAAGSGPGAREP